MTSMGSLLMLLTLLTLTLRLTPLPTPQLWRPVGFSLCRRGGQLAWRWTNSRVSVSV
jgi:hypothetical protein